MYAVVVTATIARGRRDEAAGMTESFAIPMLKSQAGHVASYFTVGADGTSGLSISVFESKEQAEASAATVSPPADAPLSVKTVEVREVIAAG
ncbi:MAG TPA: hypothetical protein VFC03_10515 [Acidimicrobiales bacterium]|nr:hypothetical protein [Acidimicrobiales bacterium]